MEQPQPNKGKGLFTASVVGKLCGKDLGRTGYSCAFEKALEITDNFRKQLFGKALDHGIQNEYDAYLILQELMPEHDLVFQSDVYKPFNENTGASSDVLAYLKTTLDETIDIKCPYEPRSFFEAKKRVNKTYEWQLISQMMTHNIDKGCLFYYLTSSHTDEDGNVIEYNLPIEKRVHFTNFKRDLEKEAFLLERINQAVAIRDSLSERMFFAREIDINEWSDLIIEDKIAQVKAYPETKCKEFLKNNFESPDNKYYYFKR